MHAQKESCLLRSHGKNVTIREDQKRRGRGQKHYWSTSAASHSMVKVGEGEGTNQKRIQQNYSSHRLRTQLGVWFWSKGVIASLEPCRLQ